MLSEESIKKFLKHKFNVKVLESVGSTNTELKKMARAGEPEGSVLIAKHQTNGRGRLGRSFYSPQNSGIYMSILFRPCFEFFKAQLITAASAISVCRALENQGALNLGIKWVNDIFLNDKKISGILTEVEFKNNSSELDFLITGIGINVTTSDFPDDIKNIAGSAFDKNNVDKNKIVADILNNLYDFYKNIESLEFLQEYKDRSILKNRNIMLVSPDKETPAKVIGIDDECHLIVELADGTVSHISTGEVSVRF